MASLAPSTCAVVVAHPDDETLFFGDVIARHREIDWHVVCVTDGRDGCDPATRSLELREACRRLGVGRVSELGFADSSRRPLPIDALVPRLAAEVREPTVLTHSALDVHPHHRQVLLACCLAFGMDRVSMFMPREPLEPAALRAKRALLQTAYPSQFRAEELLRRYPWWCEGVEHPSFVVLDSLPFEAAMLPESIWSIALEAELVTRPKRVLIEVEAARLAFARGGSAASEDGARVVDFLIQVAAEGVMRGGKAHHMAWFSGLRAIANHVDGLGRLRTFDTGDGRRSAWIVAGTGMYKIPNLNPPDVCTGWIEHLAVVARAALDGGLGTLWLQPDDVIIEPLEDFDSGLIRLEPPRSLPKASAAALWGPSN